MARIFYSLSGEGRGHATRVRAVVDLLRDRHQITIFAPGDAYDLLGPAYAGTNVTVEQIPGLRFHYTAKHRLDTVATLGMAGRYLTGYHRLKAMLRARIRSEKADLVVTDFEPSLPRAAKECGVPFISLNHQHFLVVNDLSELPGWLRRHAWLMSLVVRSYYTGMARTIVSSFYFPPLRSGFKNVIQTGVILRPSVLTAPRGRSGHLVAYLRKFAPSNVLAALRETKMPVRVYGLGKRPDDGNLHFEEINESRFLADLGTCEALISTAGNQLVGEALYLGKPVYAMPEANNHEQYINAFYLAKERTGDWGELEELDAQRLDGFLARLDEYRSHIEPEKFNGTPLAIKGVEEFLAEKRLS
ncbi:teichoic acid biosynthesis protein [bacterium]|nr:teichoic acid biosynthesis protein [bacterium]